MKPTRYSQRALTIEILAIHLNDQQKSFYYSIDFYYIVNFAFCFLFFFLFLFNHGNTEWINLKIDLNTEYWDRKIKE